METGETLLQRIFNFDPLSNDAREKIKMRYRLDIFRQLKRMESEELVDELLVGTIEDLVALLNKKLDGADRASVEKLVHRAFVSGEAKWLKSKRIQKGRKRTG
jgi:hypothetical protein